MIKLVTYHISSQFGNQLALERNPLLLPFRKTIHIKRLNPVEVYPDCPLWIILKNHHISWMNITVLNQHFADFVDLIDTPGKVFHTLLCIIRPVEFPHIRDVLQENSIGNVFIVQKRFQMRLTELWIKILYSPVKLWYDTTVT